MSSRTSRLMLISGYLAATFILANCSPNETPELDLIYTQAAQTVVSGLTQEAPTATLPPTATEAPLATAPLLPVDTLPAPTPTITTPPEAILADDFASKTGWTTEVTEGYSYGYLDRGYFIYVNTSYATIWSGRDFNLSDVSARTNARRTSGPENGYYGVTCKNQDGSNFYILVIASDGFFGIGKMVNNQLEFIQEGVDQSGVIKRGDAANDILGECTGTTLRLVVNGQQLAEVEDSTFTKGAVGMVAGTRNETGLRILYENFVALAK